MKNNSVKNNSIVMNLQHFAEEVEDVTEVSDVSTAEGTTQEQPNRADEIVQKLQKRLGKEQGAKREAKEQLDEALKRIEELENQSKLNSPQLSEDDELTKRDKEIEALRQKIKLSEVTQQADEVLKDSGLALNRDQLSLVVDTDEKVTYKKVETLINLLEEQKRVWATERNTGITPKKVQSNEGVDPFKKIINGLK
ncbi:capsid assembly scaffolding protein Gp46 family protein [Vagococcus luciliae]|uniref:DUF4355 domain-containing protein n=1 Tax=Vagococcus luciliae TaxID=2920380 RepID=A0ABY5P0X0_9ENTE|nr:DUF4355 domain-containing protein [Vagococcus luciliae]UUV99571.1 hypothetical protein G314FT_17320 [Vagococcus luciliae]